jgi:hypothetical protein
LGGGHLQISREFWFATRIPDMSDFGKSESKEHLAQFGDEENVKYTSDEGVQITRKQTTIEKEVLKRKAAAHEYLADIPEMEETKEIAEYDVNPYIPLVSIERVKKIRLVKNAERTHD